MIQLKNQKDLTEKQKKYLAIWWFSFYCFGVNLIDIAKLQYKHIKNGRWYYDRSKTGEKFCFRLNEEALNIINNFKSDSSYLFPILSEFHKTCQQ